jgi:hypothetical protein
VSWRAYLALGTAGLFTAGCLERPAEERPLELLRFRQIDGRNVCLNEDLDFFFSDELDRTSITQESVRISDEQGHSVEGAFRLREKVLSFQPELPRAGDLSDGGLKPGSRYRVVLGGFPRPDGIRSRTGTLLSATLVLSFETARLGGEHPLFLDPFAGTKPLLPVSTNLGSGEPIRLECGEALDPTSVSGADFELSRFEGRGERVVIPLSARLKLNQRRRAVLELEPERASLAASALDPGVYYLRMVDRGLKTLGGRSVEPSWKDPQPLTLRVFGAQIGELDVDFALPDPRGLALAPEEPAGPDGTAAWIEGRPDVGVRFPAAAGDGREGDLELRSAPAAGVQASGLLVPAGALIDLSEQRGLVVLAAQRAFEVRGRLVRRAQERSSRTLLDELERLVERPRESWPDLSSWLAEARSLDEPWTVLIAGGDLRIPEGGSIEVDGPLLLVAGGWIRVKGRVDAIDVWRTPEARGNISGRDHLANPLVAPLRLAAVSRSFRPRHGLTSWRPAEVKVHGTARVSFLGTRTIEGRVEEIGPSEDLMLLGDCAEVRVLIELEVPASTGEPWDPPRVEELVLAWNEPLPAPRAED